MKDLDIYVELLLDGDSARGWRQCPASRWQDPRCVPGIGSKVYTDTPFTAEKFLKAIERALSSGDLSTSTRPFSLVIFGNNRYVSVYPVVEEIGPEHPHRSIIERHFSSRGLNYLTESLPIDWTFPNVSQDISGFRSDAIRIGQPPEISNFKRSLYHIKELLRPASYPIITAPPG